MKLILNKLKLKIYYSYLFIRPKYLNNYSFLDLFKIPNIINVKRNTILCDIMHKKGSDKAMFTGKGRHNYTPVYHSFFEKNRNQRVRLLEVGIGTNNPNIDSNMGPNGKPGASLRGWKEYFHSGEIFGIDIDKSILFKEDRIDTFYCDQTNDKSIELLFENNLELKDQFDIIIDDGLHTFNANRQFLESSIHKLKKNGIYIIEDVLNTEIDRWLKFLNISNNIKFNFKFLILRIPNNYNKYDNNLILIRKIN
jgi:SAM-dependent methyltransferase